MQVEQRQRLQRTRCTGATGYMWGLLLAAVLLAPLSAAADGKAWQKDEAIDQALGILERPWKIAMIRWRAVDYLRERAQVKTGLPAYEQQVERAQAAPSALLETLTTPAVTVIQSSPSQQEEEQEQEEEQDEPVIYEVPLVK